MIESRSAEDIVESCRKPIGIVGIQQPGVTRFEVGGAEEGLQDGGKVLAEGVVVEHAHSPEVFDQLRDISCRYIECATHQQRLADLRWCATAIELVENRGGVGRECDRLTDGERVAQNNELFIATGEHMTIEFSQLCRHTRTVPFFYERVGARS